MRTGGWRVGVDGGATRCRVLLVDEAGRPLARTEGGPALLGVGEDEAIADRIGAAVRALVAEAGGTLPVAALHAGLAGASGQGEARAACTGRLERLGVARRVTVGSDADVAWADAFGEGPGILVVAGTGSVGLARGSAAGPLLRVGGWGALVGDGGSAYRIALEGIRAALAGAEGLGPPTALADQLLSGTGVEGLAGLYRWSVDARKADLAALAPGVVEVARAGDEVAGAIVSEAVEAILAHAVALRARIREHGASFEVALVGGLVEPDGPLRERVEVALRGAGFTLRPGPVDAARGAARLAAQGEGD